MPKSNREQLYAPCLVKSVMRSQFQNGKVMLDCDRRHENIESSFYSSKHALIESMEKRLFLPTALLVSAIALWMPSWFVWAKPSIVWLLGIIMFGMGLTLEAEDFKQVWENRRLVVAGVTLQYTMMPLLALGVGLALGLPDELIGAWLLLARAREVPHRMSSFIWPARISRCRFA